MRRLVAVGLTVVVFGVTLAALFRPRERGYHRRAGSAAHECSGHNHPKPTSDSLISAIIAVGKELGTHFRPRRPPRRKRCECRTPNATNAVGTSSHHET